MNTDHGLTILHDERLLQTEQLPLSSRDKSVCDATAWLAPRGEIWMKHRGLKSYHDWFSSPEELLTVMLARVPLDQHKRWLYNQLLDEPMLTAARSIRPASPTAVESNVIGAGRPTWTLTMTWTNRRVVASDRD